MCTTELYHFCPTSRQLLHTQVTTDSHNNVQQNKTRLPYNNDIIAIQMTMRTLSNNHVALLHIPSTRTTITILQPKRSGWLSRVGRWSSPVQIPLTQLSGCLNAMPHTYPGGMLIAKHPSLLHSHSKQEPPPINRSTLQPLTYLL